MIQYATNPFKDDVHSVVTALSLFDCDGKELAVKDIENPAAHLSFQLPMTSNLTQVCIQSSCG